MKKLHVFLLALITLVVSATAQAQVSQGQARNYQIDETHTGYAEAPGLTPPLRQKWAVNFGKSISYPLIADGRVFVTVGIAAGSGTKLYALNAASGSTLWLFSLGAYSQWSALCYENGRVFAINGDGLLRAFDAATGDVVWSRQLPGQYSFTSAPTVFQGVIYTGGAGSGGTAYAVSADTGTVLWTASVANGDNSSPAVTADAVYLSYACPNVYKLNRTNGALIWRYNPGCSGGGGKTPVFYNGRLYVRDYTPDYIFDSQTGGIAGSFISKSAPAFSGNMGFFMNGPKYFGSFATLEGRNVDTNSVVWSFTGDGFLQSSMLAVNQYVYVGSDRGQLYAVNAATGQQVWSTNVGTGLPYVDEHNSSQPLTGFAAGEGILVIPTKTTLVAYEADPAPSLTWGDKMPAANASGWNTSSVDIPFTASARTPGGVTFSTPGSPVQFSSEGRNQTQQVTVSDEAGNTANYTSPTVNIDWTAPVTTKTISGTTGNDGWYTSAAQVSLTASDPLSGIRNIYYQVDGGATQTYVGPFSISSEGSHGVSYWSVDVAGNTESQQGFGVLVDLNAPSTQASISGTPNGMLWYREHQITLTASDAASGVANTYYKDNGGATQTYSGPFSVSSDGNHTISYWSVDVAGKAETPRNLYIKTDNTAPTTDLSSTGTNGWNLWRTSAVQVTLWRSDTGSGVAATYYTVDGGATQTYTGPFTVDGNGQHPISFWSVDNVGNIEIQKSSTVKIDKDGPTVETAVSGPAGNNNYFTGAVPVSLTATDTVAGMAYTTYQIDSGTLKSYSSPFSVTGDGTHTVKVWSTDMAGNVSASTTVVNIDSIAPTTQATLSGTAAANGWYSTPVQVTLGATDNTSGIADTYYALDGGLPQSYSTPFTISNTGTHTILYWSIDRASNAESQRSMIIKVDVTAPSTQASTYGSSYGAWYQSPAQVGFATSDGDSGVANSYYTIDGGATQTYAGLFSVSAGGIHTVNYWSVDTAGNAETQKSFTVQIDNTAPSTQISTSGTTGTDGWYRSSVQVSLAGSDSQAGVNVTLYRVDGGVTQVYSGAFVVSGEGQHQVNYWSNDKVSNTELQQAATIKIDSTVPTAQNAVSGPAGGNGYYKGAVQFTITAADNLSGVANKYYRIDGGATQAYGSPFSISADGNHVVDFWSVDLAGNGSNVASVIIKIDTTGPLTLATPSGTAGTNGWYRSSVLVSLSASDSLSGVANRYYKIDGGTTKTYSTPFTISANGPHTVTFWSTDLATNTETVRSMAVNIDQNEPGVTSNANPSSAPKGSTPLSVTISGKVTDTHSGANPNGTTYSVVDEYGITQPSGSVTLQANGNYSFILSLPATRNSNDSNAHLYTIMIRAEDQAGNVTTDSTTVKIQ